MTKRGVGVHVARIVKKHKGKTYETFLLRRSYREDGKVKHQTLGNLTKLPGETIEILKCSLKGEILVPPTDLFEINRSLLHGHVAAVGQMVKKLEIDKLLGQGPDELKRIVLALIVSRVIYPRSKLATTRWWKNTSLSEDLLKKSCDTDSVYKALDWLLTKQDRIEKQLAKRHLTPGGIVLYDISSSFMEGRTCPLSGFGHSRDKKRGKPQIVWGLTCDQEGRPVAVQAFPGGTVDTTTLSKTIDTITKDFGLREVVIIGDRGMITSTRIEELKKLGGISWITALRSKQIQALAKDKAIQLSLFDETNLAEVTHPDYPEERLVVCRNPAVAKERKRVRDELIDATKLELDKVMSMVSSGRLKGRDKIGLRVGKVINRFKVAKHFELNIEESEFSFSLKDSRIKAEAGLDGIYVLRTNVTKDKLKATEVVESYKSLVHVEQAFRSLKTIDLKVRPINHRLEDRVRSHLLLCMLAYYVTWHLKKAWAPITFTDEEPPIRTDPVSKASVSVSAKRKAARKITTDGYPIHSFRGLLEDLATLTRNKVTAGYKKKQTFDMLSTATPLQRRAFDLLQMPIPLKLS